MLETTREQFKKWVLSHTDSSYQISQNDAGHIELESHDYMGYVNFYDMQIVELRITRISDTATMFFLHFAYEDFEQAKNLFFDFLDTFKQLSNQKLIRVLLTCSSALTTNYFAHLINEKAKGTVWCVAKDIQSCMHMPQDYDCILIAPQVGYAFSQVRQTNPNIPVFVVPAKIFGTYDALGFLSFLQEQLKQYALTHTSHLQRFDLYFHDPRKLLIISVFNQNDSVSYLYRVYQSGHIIYENHKEDLPLTIAVLQTILDEVLAKEENIDRIGISCPGVIMDGTLRYEAMHFYGDQVVEVLQKAYSIPVELFNDANMIVTGLYWTNAKHHSLVFLYQAEGMIGSGTGIIVNGHLLRGYHNYAGETKHVRAMLDAAMPTITDYERMIRSIVILISTISPEAIYFNNPLLKDTAQVHQDIARHIPDYFIPELYYIQDIQESMMIGTFLRTLWKILDQSI